MRTYSNPTVRFFNNVEKSEDGCFLWNGRKQRDGYGEFKDKIDGKWKRVGAHRWVYEEVFGKIPEGLEIDHLCNVRNCVNPYHMETVTRSENNKRRWSRDLHSGNSK